MTRSCNEMGVCQVRRQPCAGCTSAFAPGVIEHYAARRSRLQRLINAGVVLAVVCAVGGLLAGYARGKGWL